MSPDWCADQYRHVYQSCEANGKGRDEEALMRVVQDARDQAGVLDISQAGYESEKKEKDNVQNEEYD